MTGSEVLLDTWAWWEILFDTSEGSRLSQRYLDDPSVRVHSSALAIGELVAKLWSLDGGDDPEQDQSRRELEQAMVASILGASEVHDVTAETCELAGSLRAELREASADASLADAIMLATARDLDATLISNDGAFEAQPDVRGP